MKLGYQASTPIHTDILEKELTLHPDPEFVSYLCSGLRHGFDTKIDNVELHTKVCKNLLSTKDNTSAVSELINKECEKGYLLGPFSMPPFPEFRISPIGIVEGKYSKKQRLIVDLSAPHDDPNHPSINGLIDKEACSLTYVTIDHAIKIIQELGQGAYMCKADITDAFKLIPIKPEQWHLFGIKWQEQFYFYQRLAFGCRSSPVIFDHLSQAVCWIAQNNCNIPYILHLLDDFLTISAPNSDGEDIMKRLCKIFKDLGIPLAAHKTVGPSTELEYLGIILDSVNMEARLPEDKITRITAFLETTLEKRSCTKRELLQLLGHLNFCTRIIKPGRSFISYLIKLSTTVKKLHHRVYLNKEYKEDIHMWLLFLRQWNGISMFYDINWTTTYEMELYTDASSTIGFGAYYHGYWFAVKWPKFLLNEIQTTSDKAVSMAFMELYPIVAAVVLWGEQWRAKKILFYCDNLATVNIINKGRSKALHIMKLMRKLTWLAACCNFTFHAEHVPGVKNNIADSLSRLQLQRFRQLAPQASKIPSKCPPPSDVIWN